MMLIECLFPDIHLSRSCRYGSRPVDISTDKFESRKGAGVIYVILIPRLQHPFQLRLALSKEHQCGMMPKSKERTRSITTLG